MMTTQKYGPTEIQVDGTVVEYLPASDDFVKWRGKEGSSCLRALRPGPLFLPSSDLSFFLPILKYS